MEFFEFIEHYHGSLTVLLAAAGGGAALWRYFKSERQTQAKVAADFIRNFSDNEKNKLVMRCIDYSSGVVTARDERGIRELRCEEGFIVKALRTHSSILDKVSRDEEFIRTAFDHFLSDLEMFDFLIDGRVINEKDFGSYFSYWIKRIGPPPASKACSYHVENELLRSQQFRDCLWGYIHYYEFRRVPRLIERLYHVAVRSERG